jgi:hypothetical protein
VAARRLARRDRRGAGLSPGDEATILEATAATVDSLAGQAAAATADAAGPFVLGCPAHHRAEELLVEMLAAVAGRAGSPVRGVSSRTLPADVEDQVARTRPAVVFVAVLPPGGLEQARYLCRRLRRRFDRLPIVVGYFGRARDFDRLLVRLRRAGASYVTTSLQQTRTQIAALLSRPDPPPAAAPAQSAPSAHTAEPERPGPA